MALVRRNTAYSLNDIAYTKFGIKLKCTTAGTTSTNPLIITGSSTITDGTVVWEVQQEQGGSGKGLVDYAPNTSYNVGDIVIYDDKIYKCITAHTSTSTFNDTKWEEISGGADLPEWQANTSYTVGQYLVYEGTVYKVTTNFTSTTTFDDTNLEPYIAPVMTGATSSNDGKSGIVPQPTTNDVDKFLKGDGTWAGLSSSGLFVSKKILYQGTYNDIVLNTPLALTDSVNNYDKINFVGRLYINPSDRYASVEAVPNTPNGFLIVFQLGTSSVTPIYVNFGNNYDKTGNFYIEGIKFIPSNSVYISKDILWTGNENTATPTGTTLSLTNNYTDYDYLLVYFGYNTTIEDTSIKNIGLFDCSSPYSNFEYVFSSRINSSTFSTVYADIKFSGATWKIIKYVTTISDVFINKIVGIKFLPNPNNYSTTEQEIGTWIDGKKLYQKTISYTIPAGSGLQKLTIETLQNIDMVTEIFGVSVNGVPVNATEQTTYALSITCWFDLSTKELNMTHHNDGGDVVIITIRYTKV